MNKKFSGAILLVLVTLGILIYSAIDATAKGVVTVAELVDGAARERIQVGARLVVDREIEHQSSPERMVRFRVHDIANVEKQMDVVYKGTMPDTLKPGRDVILQGEYSDGVFQAKSLVTQCPSKYKPPVPE